MPNYQKWVRGCGVGEAELDIMIGRVGGAMKRTWLAKRGGYGY